MISFQFFAFFSLVACSSQWGEAKGEVMKVSFVISFMVIMVFVIISYLFFNIHDYQSWPFVIICYFSCFFTTLTKKQCCGKLFWKGNSVPCFLLYVEYENYSHNKENIWFRCPRYPSNVSSNPLNRAAYTGHWRWKNGSWWKKVTNVKVNGTSGNTNRTATEMQGLMASSLNMTAYKTVLKCDCASALKD